MAYVKPTPKIREGKEIELRSSIANLIHRYLTGSNPYKNCLNCTHWDYGKDQCGKFNAKPPTDIIVYSCPQYEDNDDIPF